MSAGYVDLVLVAAYIIADPRHRQDPARSNTVVPVRSRITVPDERLVGPFSALWYRSSSSLPLFLFTETARHPRACPGRAAGVGRRRRHQRGPLQHHRQVALSSLPACLCRRVAVFAFGGISARERVVVGGLGARPVRHHPPSRRNDRRCVGGALDDRFGSKRVIGWALSLFILASVGVLSVDSTHVLFVHPVGPRCRAARRSLPGRAGLRLASSSSGLPRRSRRRAGRCSRGMTPSEKTTEFFGFFSFSARSLPLPGRSPSAWSPPRRAAAPGHRRRPRVPDRWMLLQQGEGSAYR